MNRIFDLLSLVMVLLLQTGCLKEENLNIPYRGYGPIMKGDSWAISEPEMENMDKNVIELVYRDFYNESKYPTIRSLLIVRNGKLVAEGYCKDNEDINNMHNIKSATKSVTSILTGIMLDNGELDSLNCRLFDYLPQYFNDNNHKKDITLRHVLTMETGLEFDDDIHTREMLYNRGSSLKFVLDRDLVFEPGTSFYYGDGNPQLLSGLIFEITGKTESEFAKEYLFGPLGISNYIWESTHDGLSLGAIGLWLTPRDMAKIGVLMAKNGLWNGARVVSETWIKESTRDQSSFSNYGYYWYPIEDKAFYAEGHGGQLIWVYPEYDLVVVITSDSYAKSWNLSAPYTDIFSGIIASLKDKK